MGGELKIPEDATAVGPARRAAPRSGPARSHRPPGRERQDPTPLAAAAAEFILEGLWAHKRISRNEERGFFAERPKPAEPREPFNRPPRRQYN